MAITRTSLDFLTSPQGESLLAELVLEDLSDKNTLSLVMRLRERFDREQVSAAISLAQLRHKAAAKFGEAAARMFFTEDALQQASDPLIRAYRAQGVAGLRVLDVGCGIGSDSLAFAAHGARTLGLDIDVLRVRMARLNAEALGSDAKFVNRDVRQGLPGNFDLIFYDPARRDERGKRIYDVAQYIPPLSLVRDWSAQRIIVKLSPGVDVSQLAAYGGGLEFISVAGDLKEGLLHIGGEFEGVRAVRVDEAGASIWQREGAEPDLHITEPQSWLCEPDPAIIRSGLVRDVAQACDGALLDEMIAYFTTVNRPQTDWVRAWQIRDWMPFNLKKLRAYLRQRDIGTITVKKRGSPITPQGLTRKLKLNGVQSATIVLTKYQNEPIVLVCDDFVP